MVESRKQIRMSQRNKQPLFDVSTIINPLILCDQQGDNVAVVVDERLSRELQQHQRDGVVKMYNIVSRYVTPPRLDIQQGFILADKQGLGNVWKFGILLKG